MGVPKFLSYTSKKMDYFDLNIKIWVYWQLYHTCSLALTDLLKHFNKSIIHIVHIFTYL
jgi:hypothetical protein